MHPALNHQLQSAYVQDFRAAQGAHVKVSTYSRPRRLALVVFGRRAQR